MQAEARRILAEPQFREPSESFVQRAIGWLLEQVARIVGQLSGGGRDAVFAWLLLILSAMVIVAVIVKLRQSRGPRPPAADTEGEVLGRSRDEWRAEAARYRAAGSWREAVRALHRAVVADLAQAGFVEEIPGRTAGEYLVEARLNLPEVGEPLAEVTRLFERAWYGPTPVTVADLDRVEAEAQRVRVPA